MELRGIYPALVSPFNPDLSFNYGALREVVRETKKRGVHGFYVGGSTAETFSLSLDEREKALETVLDAAGDSPVIAHVGTLNPMDLKRLASHAARAGAAAVSSVPPFYFKHGEEEIDAYYQDLVAASEGLKVILYNIPVFTGVTLNKKNCAKLFTAGGVAGIKHTSHNLYDLERLKSAFPEAIMLSGHDEVFCPAQLMGAEGCIGSTLNIMPRRFAEMDALIKAGKYDEAMKVQRRVNDVIDAMQQFNFFGALKYILELQGFPVGDTRRPLLPLSDENKKMVGELYRKYLV
ncbi:MAG: dihydrodipicolinate synthase family protein [Planctomycetota bacterium]|jgi:N-acetylneuraminate lyase|nr:dihydrodipicolinate synthase family protein [Planctomycetota bacterium]